MDASLLNGLLVSGAYEPPKVLVSNHTHWSLFACSVLIIWSSCRHYVHVFSHVQYSTIVHKCFVHCTRVDCCVERHSFAATLLHLNNYSVCWHIIAFLWFIYSSYLSFVMYPAVEPLAEVLFSTIICVYVALFLCPLFLAFNTCKLATVEFQLATE